MKPSFPYTCRENLNERSGNALKGLLLFVFLVLIFSAALFFLYSRQVVSKIYLLNDYESDMEAYILEMQGKDSGYCFPYPVLFTLGAFFNRFLSVDTAMASAVTLLHMLSMAAAYYYVRRGVTVGNTGLMRELTAAAASIMLFLVSMLFLPQNFLSHVYLGTYTPNPFHNATSVAAKPFAIAAFFSFCTLTEKEDGWSDIKNAVFFALSLLLCVMAKPSYPLVFLSAAGLTEIFRLIRFRFKNMREAITLLICVTPTVLFMLYQNSAMQSYGSEGFGLCLGTVWKIYSDCIPLSVIKGIAFPLAVLAFNFRRLKDSFSYRFVWFQYVIGLMQSYFFYEKGFRMNDGNFIWGYQYGMFFLFVVSVIVLLNSNNGKKQKSVQWVIFGAHLLCGILYFLKILTGGTFR